MLSGNAIAALEEADLLSPGDGLLTQDTETGLEWLDITMTLNLSHTEIMAGYADLVTAHRFRYATRAEVHTLFENANIPDITDVWTMDNGPPIRELQELIGKTEHVHSSGWLIRQTKAITGDTDGEDHYAAKAGIWVERGSGVAASSWERFAKDERRD